MEMGVEVVYLTCWTCIGGGCPCRHHSLPSPSSLAALRVWCCRICGDGMWWWRRWGEVAYMVLSYWKLGLRLGVKDSYFGLVSSLTFELDDCEILAVLVIVADSLGWFLGLDRRGDESLSHLLFLGLCRSSLSNAPLSRLPFDVRRDGDQDLLTSCSTL